MLARDRSTISWRCPTLAFRTREGRFLPGGDRMAERGSGVDRRRWNRRRSATFLSDSKGGTDMPAKSQAQQKAAGAALSAKRGETKKGELKGASKRNVRIDERKAARGIRRDQAQRACPRRNRQTEAQNRQSPVQQKPAAETAGFRRSFSGRSRNLPAPPAALHLVADDLLVAMPPHHLLLDHDAADLCACGRSNAWPWPAPARQSPSILPVPLHPPTKGRISSYDFRLL